MTTGTQRLSFLDIIASSTLKSIIFLGLISITFLLFIGKVHLFDWDEINFAESAREMILTGDYMHVRIDFLPFWEKPPFFFWLQVLSMKVFGINEFAARFPNAIVGFSYLISFYFIGKKHFSAKFGLVWGLLFVITLLPHLYFKSGIIDPVFNLFIFLSIYFIMQVLAKEEDRKQLLKYALIAGLFSALSVLTKGPVGFLLMGLTVFIYLLLYRFKNFPSINSILLFLVGFLIIIIAWLSVEVMQNGWENMIQFVQYQIGLFNQNVAGHAQPFYYHTVVILIGCFPISILALKGLFKNEESSIDFYKWMLILFWIVLILFSIVKTKIIHYSSMTYIPLAFIATNTLLSEDFKDRFSKVQKSIYLLIGIVLSLILISFPILLAYKGNLYPYIKDQFALLSLQAAPAWTGVESLVGILFLLLVIIGFIFLRKGEISKYLNVSIVGMVLIVALTFSWILPKAEEITQKPLISFLKEKAKEDCYIESEFKSYAPYFYGEVTPEKSKGEHSIEWLIRKQKEKPVYVITKPGTIILTYFPKLQEYRRFSGYIIYKHTPEVQ